MGLSLCRGCSLWLSSIFRIRRTSCEKSIERSSPYRRCTFTEDVLTQLSKSQILWKRKLSGLTRMWLMTIWKRHILVTIKTNSIDYLILIGINVFTVSRSAIRSFTLILLVLFVQQLCFYFLGLAYMDKLNIPSEYSLGIRTIVWSALQLIGCGVAYVSVEKIGRKVNYNDKFNLITNLSNYCYIFNVLNISLLSTDRNCYFSLWSAPQSDSLLQLYCCT